MDSTEIHNQLLSLADPEYQKFSSGLLPGVPNILGVSVPKLHKLAKQIAKEDWQRYLETASDFSYEEVLLQGLVIGYSQGEINEIMQYITWFVPKIDNWGVCDSFCAGLKITKKYPEEMWRFLQEYLNSDQEFHIRFGVVMILNYFIDEMHLQDLFLIFNRIHPEGYYAKMAVAWAVSICYKKFPDKTEMYLRENELDLETYLKALQKILELHGVDPEKRSQIRVLRKSHARKRS